MTQENLNTVIAVIVIPLAGALIPLFIAYLNQKTQEIKDKRHDAQLNKYIDIAEDAIQTAVLATYQTVVSRLKGTDNWTEQVQAQVFEDAKAIAITTMGTACKEAMQELHTDFDTWIDNKIESYVKLPQKQEYIAR